MSRSLSIQATNQFTKDLKRMRRRGAQSDKLIEIVNKLKVGETLEPKYRDHQLVGNWKGHRECHVQPDWLLIYLITDEDLILVRTGSHSDLF